MYIVSDKNGTRIQVNGAKTWLALYQTGIPNLHILDDFVEIGNNVLSVAYLRLILQFAAMHCKVGGEIRLKADIGIMTPYVDALQQEVSLVLGHCIEKRSETRSGKCLRLTYIKKSALPIEHYAESSLTLGIISSGRAPKDLAKCLDGFAAITGIIAEILVCGPVTLHEVLKNYPMVRLLPFVESATDPRPQICQKKNLIAQQAIGENLLIVHERIRPTAHFASTYNSLSPHFEVIGCELRDVEGDLISGWNLLPYHDHTGAARLGVRISRLECISPQHYGNGAVIFCKRAVYLRFPLDSRLHWGDMEDNHWYQKLWTEGVSVSTISDLVCSDFSKSLTTNRRSRWRPSGFSLWHSWVPSRCHTLPQYFLFTLAVVIRIFIRRIVFVAKP
jgi:hypothetical protein